MYTNTHTLFRHVLSELYLTMLLFIAVLGMYVHYTPMKAVQISPYSEAEVIEIADTAHTAVMVVQTEPCGAT